MKLEIKPKNKLMRKDLDINDYILFEGKYHRVICIVYEAPDIAGYCQVKSITIDLSEAKLGRKVIIKKLNQKNER